MIPRQDLLGRITEAVRNFPVTALLGPRQCGKTTMARMIEAAMPSHYFSLDDPVDRTRLTEAPLISMENLEGLVILDEIQAMPELFTALKVLVDRKQGKRFLILGSASPALVKASSESLAGRIAFVDMGGFSISETAGNNFRTLWYRGGFPPSYLAEDEDISTRWREGFIRTFLERDIPQLGITIPAVALRRFWTMLAYWNGQVWNAAEFARAMGNTEPTVRRYLDILTGAYMIRQLQPWYVNLNKRQVKSPKIYFRDSGLLHSLLSLGGDQVTSHPKAGASWEGFVIEQIYSLYHPGEGYFWATHAGAELDYLLFRDGKAYGFEVKYTDAPATTRSMHIAMENLGLKKLFVIYPGTKSYSLAKNIEAVPVTDLPVVFGG